MSFNNFGAFISLRNCRWLAAIICGIHSALLAAPAADQHTFFVATNGNDAWSGRLAAPNRQHDDGPLATVPRALQVIREHRRQWPDQTVITLAQRGGTYFLDEPIVLRPEDSRLQWRSYRNEKPVVSGGRAITGWREVTVNGRKLWSADVPGARNSQWFFRELWINSERRVRARHPNSGYFKI